MFLARENNKSKTYHQLMSFIQMTKTTNIYILHENKEYMVLHNTLTVANPERGGWDVRPSP